MRFALASLFALGIFCKSVSGAAVTTLDAASFNGFVGENNIALVEFFAPWCGHCKKLAPEYEAAATELASSNIKLASVDCTVEKDLCAQFDVNGFPTLKVFRGSTTAVSDYGGGRTSSEIIKYMKKQTEPSYKTINDAEALAAAVNSNRDGVLLIGVFSSNDSSEAQAFIGTAEVQRNDHSFIIVNNLDLVKTHAPTAVLNSVVLLKADESDAAAPLQSVVSTGPFDQASLATFIKAESFPLCGEIGPENFQSYVERGYPLVWIFVDNASPLTAPTLAVARQVGATVKSSLSLVHLDGVKWADHAKHFGLHAGELPGIVLEDRNAVKNYIFPYSTPVTVESLQAWVDSYAAGTLAPNVKSQEIPANNDGPVTTIVGKSFDSIVFDDEKDVLVEFYAPWCGHCKSLAPKYEALGKIFENNEKVVIGQIDATENDSPAKIKGFPTIILYKAGDKKNPVTYEGERTETAIASWLRANGNTFAAEEAHGHSHEDAHGHSHDDL